MHGHINYYLLFRLSLIIKFITTITDFKNRKHDRDDILGDED